jgi:hypothetical protein
MVGFSPNKKNVQSLKIYKPKENPKEFQKNREKSHMLIRTFRSQKKYSDGQNLNRNEGDRHKSSLHNLRKIKRHLS